MNAGDELIFAFARVLSAFDPTEACYTCVQGQQLWDLHPSFD